MPPGDPARPSLHDRSPPDGHFRRGKQAPEGHLTVDFLTGRIPGGQPSAGLVKAISLCRDELPRFCGKHGASIEDFREFTVRFVSGLPENRFIVTIEDAQSRRSSAEYGGVRGKRVKPMPR